MMTPKQRAMRIVEQRHCSTGMPVDVARMMVADEGMLGQAYRVWLTAIEAGIEEDRALCAKAHAPS